MTISKDFKKIIEKKSIFLVIVVVLGFLVGGVVVWGGFSSKMLAYENQMKQKKEKSQVIEKYDKIKKEFEVYVNSFSKPLTPDALTNQIAEYASQNNVDVEISPQSPKKVDEYVSTSIRLNVRSKDFKSIVLFIQMLESSPYSFRVDNWSGRMEDPVLKQISCDLNVTSVQVKK